MAQHGYLGDDYGTRYDPNWDEDDDRERGQEWRGERERGAMFDRDREWRDRDQYRNRDDERGVFSRMGDEARSWFRDDDERGMRDWRRSDASEWFGGGSERDQAPRRFSINRDDHYRNWRDKQMQALDRDYEDYCREREQQFHQDFDSWRQNRQQPRGQVSSGRFDPTGSSTNALNEPQVTVDPESAATLGTGTDTPAGRRKG